MAVTVWLVAGIAAAGTPIFVAENWDDYAPGTDDMTYLEQWVTIPGAQRYEITANAENAVPGCNSMPNSLIIRKQVVYGISRDLSTEIAALEPDATMVIGTDTDVLQVKFIVDFNSLNGIYEDIIVEVSHGDVHVDATNGTPKDVIAFGMTNGWFGTNTHPRIFNGRDWILAEGVATDKRWNEFTLTIAGSSLTLDGSRKAFGTHTVERAYLGGFDTISVRTTFNDEQRHHFDDISITGGQLVEEVPPLEPTVTSVDPEEGLTEGGTAITVSGSNFLAGAAVRFGGAAATDVNVVSAATITCLTPPHAPGVVDVEVENPDGGTGSLPSAFAYVGSEVLFRRGDANQDGGVNIADAIYILQRLFAGGSPILCEDAGDANDDESLNIADAVYILQRLFAGGAPIPPPHPDCGIDTTSKPEGDDLPDCVYDPEWCEG
jgi:hypothetical protein